MKYLKKIVYFLTIIHSVAALCSQEPQLSYTQRRTAFARKKKETLARNRAARSHRPWFRNRAPHKRRITHMLGEFAEDVVKINLGLFAWDSLKVFVITAPFFAGARMIDDKLHNSFLE